MDSQTSINEKYGGAWPVLVTPYDEDLKIDVAAYRTMLEWYLQFNIGGLYSNCGSSEMFRLDDEERLLLVNETVSCASGKLPVVATGNLGKTINEHIELCKRVADSGVDVVMLVVPEFCQNDDELLTYYLRITAEVNVPLGLYECGYPRQYHLGVELVRRLAETGRFVAFKETSCDLQKITAHLDATCHTPLAMLQANIPYLLEAVKAGATGSMNVVANWLPELTQAVIEKGSAGDEIAEQLQRELAEMEMVQRAVHPPSGVKYLLKKRGLPIEPRTRMDHTVNREEMQSLDLCAEKWFNEDGNLKMKELE